MATATRIQPRHERLSYVPKMLRSVAQAYLMSGINCHRLAHRNARGPCFDVQEQGALLEQDGKQQGGCARPPKKWRLLGTVVTGSWGELLEAAFPKLSDTDNSPNIISIDRRQAQQMFRCIACNSSKSPATRRNPDVDLCQRSRLRPVQQVSGEGPAKPSSCWRGVLHVQLPPRQAQGPSSADQ